MIVWIVIWEPFAMALVLGLLTSAGLYFAYLWPSVEPVDDEDAGAKPEPAAAVAKPEKASTEPASDAKESS